MPDTSYNKFTVRTVTLDMRQIAVPSHVHLSVDQPEQIFSLTSKGSSALHHIPHARMDHLSATQELFKDGDSAS